MANRSAFLGLGVSALFALCLPIGCNAVLGIDEATLKDGTAGGSGSAASAGSNGVGGGSGGAQGGGKLLYTGTNSCTGDSASNADCRACIDGSCSVPKQNTCLQDSSCRGLMDNYSQCLGNSCTTGGCFEHELLMPGMSVDNCYGKCADRCPASPIYSACELYCACMGKNCSDKITSMADCLTACNALPSEVVTCRRSHCELAGLFDPPSALHCDHATGVTFCGGVGTTSTDRATQCTDKSLNSFACVQPSECCSGNCMSNICVKK